MSVPVCMIELHEEPNGLAVLIRYDAIIYMSPLPGGERGTHLYLGSYGTLNLQVRESMEEIHEIVARTPVARPLSSSTGGFNPDCYV